MGVVNILSGKSDLGYLRRKTYSDDRLAREVADRHRMPVSDDPIAALDAARERHYDNPEKFMANVNNVLRLLEIV